MRTHGLAVIGVSVFLVATDAPPVWWALVGLAAGLVLVAKDVAAGAVLVATLVAIGVGVACLLR